MDVLLMPLYSNFLHMIEYDWESNTVQRTGAC